jgi:hypothetical protein
MDWNRPHVCGLMNDVTDIEDISVRKRVAKAVGFFFLALCIIIAFVALVSVVYSKIYQTDMVYTFKYGLFVFGGILMLCGVLAGLSFHEGSLYSSSAYIASGGVRKSLQDDRAGRRMRREVFFIWCVCLGFTIFFIGLVTL